MGRKVWVVDPPAEGEDLDVEAVTAAAVAAGAEEFSVGVPSSMSGLAASGYTGLLEEDDPPAPPVDADAERLAELAAEDFDITDAGVKEAVVLLLRRYG